MGKEGPVKVTRADYNKSFGVEVPEDPIIPDAVIHVWEWWWILNARRGSGYDSSPPIAYSEIHCWSALTRTRITPTEVVMLVRMDNAFLKSVNEEREEQRNRDRTT